MKKISTLFGEKSVLSGVMSTCYVLFTGENKKKHKTFFFFSEKPLDMINKSPNSGPSIMKKRGYEQTNGIDGGLYIQ